jgi:sugar phosphate isomerase/epimerase
MYRSLATGAIGVGVGSLEEGLDLAARHGFEGYHFDMGEAAELGAEKVETLAAAKGVRLAAWGFPVNFRGGDGEYEESMARLPQLAETAVRLGVLRTATFIIPGSNEFTYEENFAFHVERLGPAAAILADNGIRLGLEYVAPRTLWTSFVHPFAHDMEQMAQLCAAVGPNVGFLLDSWHWYTAQESAEDLRGLTPEQVVVVHINDAPAGVDVDEQVDHVRTLPGETGVIDIAAFLGTLKEIGYDGPVMVEPFSEAVRRLPAEEGCAATAAALLKVWEQAGI